MTEKRRKYNSSFLPSITDKGKESSMKLIPGDSFKLSKGGL